MTSTGLIRGMVLGGLLLGSTVTGARPSTGGDAGDFLAWGAGGRALGLGKAYVALATDATSAYWNPAGLPWVDRPELSALHAQLWEGAAYDFLGLALPNTPLGPLGVFGALLTSGGGERRDATNTVLPGTFAVTKAGFGLAWGYELLPGLAVGLSAKALLRWVDDEQSGFLTGDIGLRIAPPWLPGLVLAGVLQHGVSTRFGPTVDTLPKRLRVGLVLAPNLVGVGLLTVDVESPLQASTRPLTWRVGVESQPIGPLTARLGMDTWELAGGVGFAPTPDLRLDYAAARHHDLGLSHRVSLGVQWGASLRATHRQKAQAAYQDILALLTAAQGRSAQLTPAQRTAMREAVHEVNRWDPDNACVRRLLQRMNGVKP